MIGSMYFLVNSPLHFRNILRTESNLKSYKCGVVFNHSEKGSRFVGNVSISVESPCSAEPKRHHIGFKTPLTVVLMEECLSELFVCDTTRIALKSVTSRVTYSRINLEKLKEVFIVCRTICHKVSS